MIFTARAALTEPRPPRQSPLENIGGSSSVDRSIARSRRGGEFRKYVIVVRKTHRFASEPLPDSMESANHWETNETGIVDGRSFAKVALVVNFVARNRSSLRKNRLASTTKQLARILGKNRGDRSSCSSSRVLALARVCSNYAIIASNPKENATVWHSGR